MKISKLIFYFLFLFVLSSCDPDRKEHKKISNIDTVKSKIEDPKLQNTPIDTTIFTQQEIKIIDTIFNLPEIKKRKAYIREQTNGKRNLLVWIFAKPNLKDKYYWIKAGEDNGINFVSHFNFFVYPDSMRIMYFDTPGDKAITLKDWRRLNGM